MGSIYKALKTNNAKDLERARERVKLASYFRKALVPVERAWKAANKLGLANDSYPYMAYGSTGAIDGKARNFLALSASLYGVESFSSAGVLKVMENFAKAGIEFTKSEDAAEYHMRTFTGWNDARTIKVELAVHVITDSKRCIRVETGVEMVERKKYELRCL